MLRLEDTCHIKVIFDPVQSMFVSTHKLNEKGIAGDTVDIWPTINSSRARVTYHDQQHQRTASAISLSSENLNEFGLFGINQSGLRKMDSGSFVHEHVAEPQKMTPPATRTHPIVGVAIEKRVVSDHDRDSNTFARDTGMFIVDAKVKTLAEGERENCVNGEPGEKTSQLSDTNGRQEVAIRIATPQHGWISPMNINNEHIHDVRFTNRDEDDAKTEIIYQRETTQ